MSTATTSNPITPKFSPTYPPSQALQDLEALLKPTGKWTLSSDGKGIERSFKFKGFRKCWVCDSPPFLPSHSIHFQSEKSLSRRLMEIQEFMSTISPICVTEKHHPEWSNVYNTAFVRWTTHQPEGLSQLDVKMAGICDGVAEGLGEVLADEEGELGRALVARVVDEAGEGCCVPRRIREKREKDKSDENEKV